MFQSFSYPNGTVFFKCQHGEREVINLKSKSIFKKINFQCELNKFQSCALFLYPNADDQANIIFCTMQPHGKNFHECTKDLNLNSTKIDDCTSGSLGTILQLRAEIQSLKAKLAGVPTVTYDGILDFNDESLSNFEHVVTEKLKNKTLNS